MPSTPELDKMHYLPFSTLCACSGWSDPLQLSLVHHNHLKCWRTVTTAYEILVVRSSGLPAVTSPQLFFIQMMLIKVNWFHNAKLVILLAKNIDTMLWAGELYCHPHTLRYILLRLRLAYTIANIPLPKYSNDFHDFLRSSLT